MWATFRVGDVTVVKSSVCVALRLDDIFRPVRMLQGLVDAFGRSATCEKVDDGPVVAQI